ncbi:MAG TPA: M23 family metallopeptidase [Caulobacteraceae bacterium]|jgi:murein DD-endopeptidase MepM/ murein hydrolase activator NlpD|nr:M23 family metallopeptidase [Caulobacteraceae bacterium]
MTAKAYLARHGAHLSAVLASGILAAGATLGVAKADIAPVAPIRQSLSQSIMSGMVRVAVTPPPVAPKITEIDFRDPLPGYAINSPFGPRRLNDEDRGGRIHEGVDIAAPKGTLIHATLDGEIVKTGLSSSYGNFVEVEHMDGIHSFYAHMSRTAGLKVGEPVKAGEVIGYVGATGDATGPHLHFEIRKDGEHFDPAKFMGHAFKSVASLPLSVEHFAEPAARRAFRPIRMAYHAASGRVHHVYGS